MFMGECLGSRSMTRQGEKDLEVVKPSAMSLLTDMSFQEMGFTHDGGGKWSGNNRVGVRRPPVALKYVGYKRMSCLS